MIEHLQIRDFRCFQRSDIRFAPGFNLFVGPNAMGKTSLLEAVCVLVRLHSPRVPRLGLTLRHGAKGFLLDGTVHGHRLQVYLSAARRKFAVDSTEERDPARLLEIASAVWFSNDDTQLLRGPAAERRKFLDFLATQIFPAYRRWLREYERALRSRNRLLKAHSIPWKQVRAFNSPLAQAGRALTSARRNLIGQIRPLFSTACETIGAGTWPVDIAYASGSGTDFEAALADTEPEDARLRQTTAGPHRDDIALSLDTRPAISFASEGQQRTMVVALRLAEAQILHSTSGLHPLYLIDDVFGELDPSRRNALLHALPAAAQKLITTTHLDWLQPGLPTHIQQFPLPAP